MLRICLLLLVLASPTFAAEPPAPEAVLPAGCDNALIIEDLPGHLVALLRSQHAQRLTSDGILGTWLAEAGMDADSVLAKVENPSLPVPLRLAVGMPRQTWDDLAPLLRFGLRQGLLQSAEDLPDDPAIPALRRECVAELRAMRVPPLCVTIDFRNPMMGQQIAMMVGGFLQSSGFAVTRAGEITTYRATLGGLVEIDVLRAMAIGFKLTDALDDAIAVETGEILADKEIQVQLRARASGIMISLGDWPAQADGVASPTAPDFLAMRWDIAGLRTAVGDAHRWWTNWDDTPLGLAAAQADTQDMVGALRRSVKQMADVSATGEATLTASDDGFMVVATGSEPLTSPTIGATGLTTIAPDGAAYVHYEGAADIGSWLADRIYAIEERIDNQSLRATMRGHDARADKMEELIEAYHQHFGDLRTLVMDQHADFFLPGLVLIGETGGRLDHLEIVRTQPPESGVRANDVPLPALALISRPRATGSGADFFDRFADAAIAPLYRIGNQIAPTVLTTDVTTPGGLAAKALVSGWIDALAGEWRIRATGESVIHAADVEGWFVLSTSLALTDRIHKAIRAAKPAAGIVPEAYLQGTLRGEAIASLVRSYLPLLEDPKRLVIIGEPVIGDDAFRTKTLTLMTGIAEMLSVLGDLSWIGRNDGPGRRFELRANIVAPTLAPAVIP